MSSKPMTYAASGVDIDAGDSVVERIRGHIARTSTPRVLGKFGAFAGCFRLDFNEKLFKRNYRDPVLVACTDGVGSKVKLACEMGVYDTVGIDCVAMNVNDMIVQGAEPLMFLDYIGIHKVIPDVCERIVKGIADGCQQSDCALIGGETAELPDLYAEGEFDLAGFAVGVCELHRLIDGSRVSPGDAVIGLGSSGVHSNGYSLVRAVIRQKRLKLDRHYDPLPSGRTLGEAVLTPTRIYVRPVVSLLRYYRVKRVVTGMAHITGGGLAGNLCRALPEGCDARIVADSWPVPPIFDLLAEKGGIEAEEMRKVFNLGIGFCLIVRPDFADSVMKRLRAAGEQVHRIGSIVKGSGNVRLV